MNLTPDSRIKPGEQVLTSGGDQVFPRGLKVGTIESIAPDPDHQPYTLIVVKPAANLFQLEEVLVITGTQPELTEQAKKDLAAGAATAEEQAEAARVAAAEAAAKSAAQIVADRLPSLHDENAPETDPAKAAADAKTSGSWRGCAEAAAYAASGPLFAGGYAFGCVADAWGDERHDQYAACNFEPACSGEDAGFC